MAAGAVVVLAASAASAAASRRGPGAIFFRERRGREGETSGEEAKREKKKVGEMLRLSSFFVIAAPEGIPSSRSPRRALFLVLSRSRAPEASVDA